MAPPDTWAPDGTVVPSGCFQVTIDVGGDTPGKTVYSTETWDPANRIMTYRSSSSKTFDTDVTTGQTRYGAQIRVIADIQPKFSLQYDYRYDDHGNVLDYHISYPAVPDVNKPSTAPATVGSAYEYEYDAMGRLTASTMTQYGSRITSTAPVTRTYTEDASGNCVEIDTTNELGMTKEVRTYVAG